LDADKGSPKEDEAAFLYVSDKALLTIRWAIDKIAFEYGSELDSTAEADAAMRVAASHCVINGKAH